MKNGIIKPAYFILITLFLFFNGNNSAAGDLNDFEKESFNGENKQQDFCFADIIIKNELGDFFYVDHSNNFSEKVFSTKYSFASDSADYTFFMPNAFYPQSEGNNRCVRPCGSKISVYNFEFIIADRWGNIVFKTNYYNPNAKCSSCSKGAWDGTKKNNRDDGGKLLSEGVYLWYCKFHDENGTSYEEHGTIILLK